MAQDDQNPNREEGFQDQRDETLRESRSDTTPAVPEQQNQGTERADQGADLDEADDSDEDRDDDQRTIAGPNRRINIG